MGVTSAVECTLRGCFRCLAYGRKAFVGCHHRLASITSAPLGTTTWEEDYDVDRQHAAVMEAFADSSLLFMSMLTSSTQA